MLAIEYLNALRAAEIDVIAPNLPPRGRVLELGAGTGQQALLLQRRGFEVTAVDLADSIYAAARIFPVTEYDGAHLPFPDASFDAVISSNALEHIGDLAGMHAEIRRVLKPDGIAAHALPTHMWRFWSIMAAYLQALLVLGKALRRTLPGSGDSRSLGRAWYEAARTGGAALFPQRHGERGHGIGELWLFHPRWWRRNFETNGFVLLYDKPMGLFYTGSMILGARLPLARRARLAKILGSSCHLYIIRPAEASRS